MATRASARRHVVSQAARKKAEEAARDAKQEARRASRLVCGRFLIGIAELNAQTASRNAAWLTNHGLPLMRRLVEGDVPSTIAEYLAHKRTCRNATFDFLWDVEIPDGITKTLEDNGARDVKWTRLEKFGNTQRWRLEFSWTAPGDD